MEAVEGAKTRENPLKPLNSKRFLDHLTLLETALGLVAILWTTPGADRGRPIVHSLPPGRTAPVHNLTRSACG